MALRETETDRSRSSVAWQQMARSLAEQGRLAWLLGQGLLTALTQVETGEDPPDPLQLWSTLWQALPSLPSGDRIVRSQLPEGSAKPPKGMASFRPSSSPSRIGGVLDLTGSLADRWLPALFLGSVPVRGEEVTLALGIDPSGRKHVLGLWAGATLNPAVARQAVQDLTRRGLRTQPGLLVVTDGRRALDAAVAAAWGPSARLAHCQYQLQQEVLAHLPEKERPRVAAALQEAWAAPAEEAARRLEGLLASLASHHPGAAARLRASREAALTVPQLSLPRRLAAHLAVAGPLRVTVEHAVRWGGSAEKGVAAVRAGLEEAVRRMRRRIGAEDLPVLLQRLAEPADGRG